MTDYNPQDVHKWDNTQFTCTRGEVYTIGGGILKNEEFEGLILFIGGIPQSMDRDERIARIKSTQIRLRLHDEFIINHLCKRGGLEDIPSEVYNHPENTNSLYSALECPEIDMYLGIGLMTAKRDIGVLCRSSLITSIKKSKKQPKQ